MKQAYLINEENTINFLIIKLLAQLGNNEPSKKQINLIEGLLRTTTIKQQIFFHKHLTSREVACLYLAAQGKSSFETAKLLNLQKSTIDTHRKKIKKNLHVIAWHKQFSVVFNSAT